MGDADDDALEAARQRAIAAACLGADAGPPGRLGLYRRLIQGNLAAVARRLLPRTAAQLDRVDEGAFSSWFSRFLAEASPQTPYLRDVPVEFVHWAAPLWGASTSIPPFVPDLARSEIDRFLVEAAPRAPARTELGEVSLTSRLVFAAARKLARYDFAVDELSEPPARKPTWVFLHRDDDNAVHTTRVDEVVGHILSELLVGAPLGVAVVRGAEAASVEPSEKVRGGVARLLAELGENGGLLGADR